MPSQPGWGSGRGSGLASRSTTQAAPAGATTSHAKTITVSTGTVPHIGTVLTTASGLTLYRFTEDGTGRSTCTGACAKIWPPLLASKGSHIKGPKGVKGLSLIRVGDGHWQVAFHNVALYRFEGDKKKGQANGQAVGGKWFAVLKSGIPPATASSARSAPTSAPTSTSTQPVTSTTQGSHVATPTSPPASQMPATQSTSPPPTNPPPTSPPPTTTPTTSPPPTTTPTTTPTSTGGNGGVGF